MMHFHHLPDYICRLKFVRSWRGEQSIPYKSVETSPKQMCFKTLSGSLEVKAQRGQYRIVVGLSCYKWYQASH